MSSQQFEAVPVSEPQQPQKKTFTKMASNVGSSFSKGALKTVGATMNIGEAFVAFINRGSVIDLAIGVVMGAAFTSIVNSFVNDLVLPVIGLATQKNLDNLFLVIHCGKNSTLGCVTGNQHPYSTIVQAAGDGAATWNYGNFIQTVINFILISLAMFMLVQLYSHTFLKVTKKPEALETKECEECAEPCPVAAKKCRCCMTPFPEVQEDEIEEHSDVHKMFHKASASFLKA
ncbi:large-conductance mechanosensitive channel [Chytriomyces sp. MP71]|nr:large-conductance mechanosensitive channel [Chytriomyces sp. MP71]